jgi:hypothetical protein
MFAQYRRSGKVGFNSAGWKSCRRYFASEMGTKDIGNPSDAGNGNEHGKECERTGGERGGGM